jgi:hypothetical protein
LFSAHLLFILLSHRERWNNKKKAINKNGEGYRPE